MAAIAQDESGPREIQLPNPMGAHTWFIIVAVGAFLAWCISYVLQLQKERLSSQQPGRGSLLATEGGVAGPSRGTGGAEGSGHDHRSALREGVQESEGAAFGNRRTPRTQTGLGGDLRCPKRWHSTRRRLRRSSGTPLPFGTSVCRCGAESSSRFSEATAPEKRHS